MESLSMRYLIFGEHDPYEGFTPGVLDMQGWNSEVPAFKESITNIQPKLIFEVGSWKGCSAIHMAKLCEEIYGNTDFEIVCIDTWLGSYEHWVGIDGNMPDSAFISGRPNIYEQFKTNVILNGLQNVITPFPIDSVNGALALMHYGFKADMIYIDAGHDYDSVKADLNLYKKLVAPGGCILGDDWFHEPIKQAVADTLGPVHELSRDKFVWRNL